MEEEHNALVSTNIWGLVDLPSNKFLVGCKWVYKVKTKADGLVEGYKSQLMAKGFT